MFKLRESGKRREEIAKPKPWPTITEDVTKLLQNCPIVHEPTRGIGGPLHEETARTPPSKEIVVTAISKLNSAEQNQISRCVVVGSQLVFMDEEQNPLKAYDLGSNHHAVIWVADEPNKNGVYTRSVDVISMQKASARAQRGEPIIQKSKSGFRYVMSLCKNDIVQWTGENPGMKRVSAITGFGIGKFEITLSNIETARKEKESQIRAGSLVKILSIMRRISLDPLGIEISSEPALKHD